MREDGQGFLFETAIDAVRPARARSEHHTTAAALPAELRLGASSWAYPGWKDIVYHPESPNTLLAREGLKAYARHPLLGCAGIDRSYYQNLAAEDYARYAAQTPPRFRFAVKAHAACLLEALPRNPRFGEAAGRPNPKAFDPTAAADEVIGPILEGLGDRAGVVFFQLPPRGASAGPPAAFAARLFAFLDALPRFSGVYALEVRDPELQGGAVAEALAAAGAAPCLTITPGMPGLRLQARQALRADAPALFIRWMVRPGLSFAEAEADFKPYDQLRAEDPRTRSFIADLCLAPAQRRRPSYVLASNKAEGCTPRSLIALAQAIEEAQRARRSS